MRNVAAPAAAITAAEVAPAASRHICSNTDSKSTQSDDGHGNEDVDRDSNRDGGDWVIVTAVVAAVVWMMMKKMTMEIMSTMAVTVAATAM